MNARDNTVTLRVQIATHLDAAGESPAGKIAKAVGKSAYPSVVIKELNAMRTDGLVECEQRGKKKELAYWLAVPLAQIVAAQQADAAPASTLPDGIKPGTRGALVWGALSGGRELTGREIAAALKCPSSAVDPLLSTYAKSGILDRQKDADGIYRYRQPTSAAPQPEVGQNTGSSASDVTSTTTPAEGAAVHQPAPAAAAPSAAPAAEDDTDEEMPPADPALLASANRMLCERMEGVAHALRGSGLPGLREVTGREDLQPHVAALSGAYQKLLGRLNGVAQALRDSGLPALSIVDGEWVDMPLAVAVLAGAYQEAAGIRAQRVGAEMAHVEELLADVVQGGEIEPSEMDLEELAERAADELRNARAMVAKLEHLLASARNEADHLRRHTGAAAAPAGYIMTASKRKPRRITKPETAREAAISAIRAGAQRAEVFALVPVGRAVRGAEWREVKS